ncbi:hypothetical protein E1A91_D04G189600v1 [Gossypium mustelinum]|uniref:Organ-specific protein S2 n=1 Tax=Gossypium mustelinum TaxID=34275 RepID=A0A5D2VGC4_GOSMU|nr:hypothetical protein E1A91_D04G189600v1 [Gossypium mustelinum]
MKSFLPFFAFLSLLLFVDTIAAARKDAGEYWGAVMKDQPMPEALQELVRIEAAVANPDEKTKCHTSGNFELKEEKIIVNEEFEPRPNISAYGDDANLKGDKSSSFAEDFEPRPNISAYGGDDAGLKGQKESFTKDFDPQPNISAYNN